MQKISFISDKNMATIIRQSYIDKIERYLGKETICLIREKVVTFRMVKLNLLLSIFLITK